MQKTLLCLLILFVSIPNIIKAQIIKVNYVTKMTEDIFEFPAKLYINNKASIFIWKESNESDWELEQNNFENGVMIKEGQTVFSDANGYQIKRELSGRILHCRNFCKKETPLIYKDEIQLDWSITNESKNWEGYALSKATTTFRGRKYEAWFAFEIPINAGPWKFSGLPGLILEVRSLDGSLEIKPTGISNIDQQEIPDFLNDSEIISHTDFNRCLDKEYEQSYRKNQAIIAQMQAKYKDLEITNAGQSPTRLKTELEY